MRSELITYLVVLTIASTSSVLVILAIRRGVRFAFGAAAGYSTWLLLPAAMLAMLLPAPSESGSTIGVSLRIALFSTLSRMLDSSPGSSPHTIHVTDWTMWAIGTWVVGATLFILYLAGLQRAFVKRLGPLSGSQCVLRAARSAGCPVLLGVLQPKIVLPVDFESRYTRLERLLIFRHERTHLRRGDALWSALVALMRCLFWFNPLVHLASTCFRFDQELACDAAVLVDFPRSRRTYANAMLKTEMLDISLPVGCSWQSTRHLKERLKMVKKALPSQSRRIYGRTCVVVASLVVGFSVWAAEPGTAIRAAVDESLPNTQSAASTLAKGSVRLLSTGVLTINRDGEFTRVNGAELQLLIGSEAQVQFHSDAVSVESDGSRTLNGHVNLTVAFPGMQSVNASATKAVFMPEPGGGFKVRLEQGSIIVPREDGRERR